MTLIWDAGVASCSWTHSPTRPTSVLWFGFGSFPRLEKMTQSSLAIVGWSGDHSSLSAPWSHGKTTDALSVLCCWARPFWGFGVGSVFWFNHIFNEFIGMYPQRKPVSVCLLGAWYLHLHQITAQCLAHTSPPAQCLPPAFPPAEILTTRLQVHFQFLLPQKGSASHTPNGYLSPFPKHPKNLWLPSVTHISHLSVCFFTGLYVLRAGPMSDSALRYLQEFCRELRV